MPSVFLNGQYVALEDAKISVLDRGFTFADGVYEVIPAYKKKIFFLEEHINRLNNSLKAIYMKNPYPLEKWNEILTNLIDSNPDDFQSLYVQVTRGVGERNHFFQPDMEPTVFILNRTVNTSVYRHGIGAITREDIRWIRCDIKSIGLLPSVMLRHEASLENAQEAILTRDNQVTEGAASNVFVIKDSIVKTPVKNNFILPGITRDLVVTLLNEAGINCLETVIHKDELFDADEIWITSSTWEIVPVVSLDGKPVGDGKPGKLWQRSIDLYQQFKDKQFQ